MVFLKHKKAQANQPEPLTYLLTAKTTGMLLENNYNRLICTCQGLGDSLLLFSDIDTLRLFRENVTGDNAE